jgi:hypothetical protein
MFSAVVFVIVLMTWLLLVIILHLCFPIVVYVYDQLLNVIFVYYSANNNEDDIACVTNLTLVPQLEPWFALCDCLFKATVHNIVTPNKPVL